MEIHIDTLTGGLIDRQTDEIDMLTIQLTDGQTSTTDG